MTELGLKPSGRLGFGSKRRARSSASPEPLTSPDELSSLAFWYDADASPTIEAGGAIERWDDLSGNANHAGQAVSAGRPLKVTDGAGRDVLRFDGIDDTLAVESPPSLAAGASLFLVFAMRTRTDFSGIVSAAAATGVDHEAFFTLQNATAASNLFQWLGRSAEGDPLLIQRADGGTIGLAILAAGDGAAVFRDLNGEGSDAYDGAFATPAEIVLGGHYNEGTFGYAAIDVYELGLYARSLDTAERSALGGYLMNKYEL